MFFQDRFNEDLDPMTADYQVYAGNIRAEVIQAQHDNIMIDELDKLRPSGTRRHDSARACGWRRSGLTGTAPSRIPQHSAAAMPLEPS